MTCASRMISPVSMLRWFLRVPEILAPFLPKILTLPIPEILAVLS